MIYKVAILLEAYYDLQKLDKKIVKRISKKLSWIAENAEILDHESLKGEFSDLLKFRIGDWRVLYKIDSKSGYIFIHKIGHRKDIYS